jgi:hypothetical protein
MKQSNGKPRAAARVFGHEISSIGFAMLALIVTAGVLLLQINLRTGEWAPELLPIFYRLFAFEDYTAAYLFLAVVLIAGVPDLQRLAELLTRRIGERPALVSGITTIVLAAGALWVYHAHPLAMDEAAPYMQSKAFADGKLVGKFPPALLDWLVVPGFQNYFIHVSRQTGEVASSYWPGFALLLTPFMALGIPWLCNPVLGGLSVWVIHRLTLRITGSVQAAGAAVLFSIASAAFVVNAISFYSMTAHLLCNAIFALLLLEPTPRRAFFAGLIGGLALTLHNPVPHLLFAPPWLAWLMTRKDRWSLAAAIAAGYFPWIIAVGFGWNHLLHSLADAPATTGKSLSGSSPLADMATQLGRVLKLPGTVELSDRLIGLSKLWLWAAPLTILAAGAGFWRQRANTYFRLLLASATLTFIGYLFVPLNQGHGWGFRYFHSAWFVLPVFAAALIAPVRGTSASLPVDTNPLARWAQAGALGGLLVMIPYFAWQVHSFIGSHLAQIPQAERGQPRVVIFDPESGYYSQDLVQNDPFLRGPTIRLFTHGRQEDVAMLKEHFPDLVLLSKSPRGSVWGYERADSGHSD